jgi:hypothetical protein
MRAAAPEAPQLRDHPHSVFADNEFRGLWASFVLSCTGDRLVVVALTLLVYAPTRSPLLAAIVYASATIP